MQAQRSFIISAINFLMDYFKTLPIFNFVVFQKENPVASIVCLLNKADLHAFLFGYKSTYKNLRANDFLFDGIIKYGSELGFKTIELGGGRSTFEDDSLLKFKEKYSHKKAGFYIGSRIYNKKIYNSLIRQWREKYTVLVTKYDNRILKYRFVE